MKWQEREREDALEESLERFLRDIAARYGSMEIPAAKAARALAPSVSLLDLGPTFVVLAELPGVPSSQIKVTAGSRTVLIEGSWRSAAECGEGDAIIDESRSGRFKRAVELPEPVAGDLAVAVLENGILEIELPKCEGLSEGSHNVRLA